MAFRRTPGFQKSKEERKRRDENSMLGEEEEVRSPKKEGKIEKLSLRAGRWSQNNLREEAGTVSGTQKRSRDRRVERHRYAPLEQSSGNKGKQKAVLTTLGGGKISKGGGAFVCT